MTQKLEKSKEFLKELLQNHAKTRYIKVIMANIIEQIEDYQSVMASGARDHEDFEHDRVSCFVEIIVQSTISCALYCRQEILLQEMCDEEDFDLITEKCRKKLLKFWRREGLKYRKPRIDNALDHGWDSQTFKVLMKIR